MKSEKQYKLVVQDLGKPLHDKLKKLSEKEGRTMSMQGRRIIEKFFAEKTAFTNN